MKKMIGIDELLLGPLTSIIVLGHKNVLHLALTLASIKRNTKSRYELLLVVDDPASDMAAYLLEQPRCDTLIVNSKRVGVANAYNQAMQIARGKFITHFFDNYLVPIPKYIGGDCWLTQSIRVLDASIDGTKECLTAISILNEERINATRDGKPLPETVTVGGVDVDLVGLLSIPFTMELETWLEVGLLRNLPGRNGYEVVWDFMRRMKALGAPYGAFTNWGIFHFHEFCPGCDAPIYVKTTKCESCGATFTKKFSAGVQAKSGNLSARHLGPDDYVTPYCERTWRTPDGADRVL